MVTLRIVGYQIKSHKQNHKFKGHKRKPVDKKWNEMIADPKLIGETIALLAVYDNGSTELVKTRTMKGAASTNAKKTRQAI